MQYTEIFLAVNIENFHQKNFVILNIFAQNIECGFTLESFCRGGSYEYPQCMFLITNKENRYTPSLLYKIGVQGGIQCTLHGQKMTGNIQN